MSGPLALDVDQGPYRKAFGFLFGLLLGVGMIAVPGVTWVEQTREMRDHRPVEATVVSSSVEYHPPAAQGSEATYSPNVTYVYTVDGTTYRSSTVFPADVEIRKSRGWARRIVENHPEGATVTVYYDPSEPSDAFLLQTRAESGLLFAGVGGVLVLLVLAELVRRGIGVVT